MDTIFALASARGKSGVAVLRISGPQAFTASERLMGSLPDPHMARVRSIRSASGDLIDKALAIRFPQDASFTGEESVEIQCHGSPAVVSSILRELSDMDGLRLAEPGEFSRRALENERMDIAQIEGLGDLIEAETEAQRRQALRVMTGKLGQKVERWREQLIRAMALLEATIDFADEDVPVDVVPEVTRLLTTCLEELRAEAEGSKTAERVRDGFQVAILGAPNVGKSTLLNHLAGREVAITSDIEGTTRDVISAKLDLNGLPVEFLDTAGLRESSDVIESIGIKRARRAAEEADLRVVLVEREGEEPDVVLGPDDLVLIAKSDVSAPNGISGQTGVGVRQMLSHITEVLEKSVSGVGVAIKERHRVAIEAGISSIDGALTVLNSGELRAELAAEELRSAVMVVESLVGRVDVEHILDEVFSRFCIGK
ncbi:GTPase and tRNA-U34 5-formylation enzyme TrmE [Candidatus Rhodobacter oscarellae]|uniref:tRNA modification GTPase MnmE n=1 Tax=Candidatus Rhodobacter oscarellae TaxID=1675527 RepID=A0A0J9E833_9RHOB|nr:tRNA uridine-5-carboxymethylaminomethyl(34) synthesis GTPase MnmE [Candidatus Rhodobacter lobularis]KMW58900.1 GTPase and tRNA-U34 5-formylation enzyme TrmE [Candidatus Rhodobacter lobularis]